MFTYTISSVILRLLGHNSNLVLGAVLNILLQERYGLDIGNSEKINKK